MNLLRFATLSLLLFFSAPAATRAEADAADPAAAAVLADSSGTDSAMDRLDLGQILNSGGVLIYVLAAMSVLSLALILHLFVTLHSGQITPAAFLRDIEVMLGQGRLGEAQQLCRTNRSPTARIIQSAVDYVLQVGEPDAGLLRQRIEGEGIRQAGRLSSRISYLMDIGVIAPMVGLLGTVMGMLTSFSAVALDIHKARPMELANGVSQALITTAAGLIVAIPAMVFYSIFRGRLTRLTGGMELAATQVITLLTHRKPEA